MITKSEPAIRRFFADHPDGTDRTDREVARCLGISRWSRVRLVREAMAAEAMAAAAAANTPPAAPIAPPVAALPVVAPAAAPVALPAAPIAPPVAALPVVALPVAAPAVAAPSAWVRYADALAAQIAQEPDPFERDMLRHALLKARYVPWKGGMR